jgi:Sin3 binding region of histone deacetylase complex subunit SAP30
MKPATLKKYTDAFEIPTRPDLAAVDLATSVARHFDSFLEVDEDEVIGKFMNAGMCFRIFLTSFHAFVPPFYAFL